MKHESLKEVVKAMCKAYPGGRQAMAGALGMSETQFNNNLYEKNGCRFFEVTELEAMEDISNTSFVADYFAKRRGALLVDVPNLEDLDRVDLFSRAMRTAAARGQVPGSKENWNVSTHTASGMIATTLSPGMRLAQFARAGAVT
ncbi:YmfL family putative regulatory protein [Escherichia coli]|uniref:YmfL family putative regulatory protein n=1 Tax=Escherichia coli TaxID=562 RepID=UPI00202812E3|nr:YmfL family putative regulatory protein [Escherichia coli]